jgi:hypothetical protein
LWKNEFARTGAMKNNASEMIKDKTIFRLNKNLTLDLASASYLFPLVNESTRYLDKAVLIPKSVKVEIVTRRDNTRLYSPNKSGRRILASKIVKISAPILEVRLVPNIKKEFLTVCSVKDCFLVGLPNCLFIGDGIIN